MAENDTPDVMPYSRFAEKVKQLEELQTKHTAVLAALKTAEAKLERVTEEHQAELTKVQSQHQADLALSFLPDTEEGNEARSWLRHKYETAEAGEDGKPPMTDWLKGYKATKAGALFLQPFEAKKEPAKSATKEPAPKEPEPKPKPANGSDPAHAGRVGGAPAAPAPSMTLEDLDNMTDAQIKEAGGLDAIARRLSGY